MPLLFFLIPAHYFARHYPFPPCSVSLRDRSANQKSSITPETVHPSQHTQRCLADLLVGNCERPCIPRAFLHTSFFFSFSFFCSFPASPSITTQLYISFSGSFPFLVFSGHGKLTSFWKPKMLGSEPCRKRRMCCVGGAVGAT